jgi:hypothetical protein
MKFDVHIFTVVRVKISGVEAESHAEAAKKANESVDMNALFNSERFLTQDVVTEWADEHSHALVDVVGDTEYTKSKWLSKDLTRTMNFNRPRPKKKG